MKKIRNNCILYPIIEGNTYISSELFLGIILREFLFKEIIDRELLLGNTVWKAISNFKFGENCVSIVLIHYVVLFFFYKFNF